MTVTTQRAKLLWCPMVRAANGTQTTNVAVNTPQLVEENTTQSNQNCIADRCMMWRPIDHSFNAPGYCGLAGRPA